MGSVMRVGDGSIHPLETMDNDKLNLPTPSIILFLPTLLPASFWWWLIYVGLQLLLSDGDHLVQQYYTGKWQWQGYKDRTG